MHVLYYIVIKCALKRFWDGRHSELDEPQAKTTYRYSEVPGRHGRPNVSSSAVTEQFCREWHSRATTPSEQAASHSTQNNTHSRLRHNTHRRRDSTVELSRIGGRDTVYNFLCCWAIEVGDKWWHNDVVVEKVIHIDQNSPCQTAMESVLISFQIVDRIRRQSSGASCELCSHRRRRRDATRLDSWVASASAVNILEGPGPAALTRPPLGTPVSKPRKGIRYSTPPCVYQLNQLGWGGATGQDIFARKYTYEKLAKLCASRSLSPVRKSPESRLTA